MSRLPNSACAVVEEKKIVDYLLNLGHSHGANPCIRSIWELPSAQDCPRLLTAYPLDN